MICSPTSINKAIRSPLIFFTHDIDWISPLHPLSVAKTFTHGSKWLKFGNLFRPHLFIRQIEVLNRFDLDQGLSPVWLTGAPHRHSFRKYGLRYTIHCPLYRKALGLLIESGSEIGLHSVSSEPFARQAETLTRITGKPLHYHRSHYLRFNEKALLADLRQQNIRTDFSFGSARNVAIPENLPRITGGIRCVPTVLFDNAFFFHKPELVLQQFGSVLQEAQHRGLDTAILFHPENFAVNPALWDHYREVIKLVKALES